MAISSHPQRLAELTDFTNLVPLSLAMKSSDASLLSVKPLQSGRLGIELVEHGMEVTMVSWIIATDIRGNVLYKANPSGPR